MESRALFVVTGEITSGMVQIGMRARAQGDDVAFDEKVHGVEFVDRISEGTDSSEPALTFSYSSREELERWKEIDWSGRTVELTW